MPALSNTIQLRIKYTTLNQSTIDQTIQLHIPLKTNSYELEIDIIYSQLNKFIERHNITDSIAMYQDSDRKTHILRKDSELQLEPHETKPEGHYYINLIMVLGEQTRVIMDTIKELNLRKDNINKSIGDCQEKVRSRLGERTGQECDIGFLYAEPIKKDGVKMPASIPVTYDIEIQCIRNLLKSKEKFILKSKVATFQNLQELLEKGSSILHISSHGSAPTGDLDNYLQFQSSNTDQNLGMLFRCFFSSFLEAFTRVFGNGDSPTSISNKSKPTVVIINACHSGHIASKIHRILGIQFTIGINAEYGIDNVASQKFTCEFYDSILSDYSVLDSFTRGVDYVRQKYKRNELMCCCQSHGRNPAVHDKKCQKKCYCKDQQLKKMIFECQCPRRMVSEHIKGCKVINIEHLKGKKIWQKKGKHIYQQTFLLCCCNKIHDQSEKFQIYYQPNDKQHHKIQFKKYNNQISITQEQDHFPIQKEQQKTVFYKPNGSFSNFIDTLTSRNNKIILLTGAANSGKTRYARKLIYYILERQSVSELIVINCKNYESLLDIHLNYRLKRKGKQLNIDEIIKHLKEKTQISTSFIIFDHCDKLIQTSNQQVISLITTLNNQLPNTKIIIVLNESKSTDQFKKRYKSNIKLESDHVKMFIERWYGYLLNHTQQTSTFSRLNLTNMARLIDDVKVEGNDNFMKLAVYYEKKKDQETERQKQMKNVLQQLKENKMLMTVIVLTIFKAGIRQDERMIIDKQLQKIQKMTIRGLTAMNFIQQIMDKKSKDNEQIAIKFVPEWYDFVMQQTYLLEDEETFGKICSAYFYYINNYILARIGKEPNFYLQEFQISPFHSLPVSEKLSQLKHQQSMYLETTTQLLSPQSYPSMHTQHSTLSLPTQSLIVSHQTSSQSSPQQSYEYFFDLQTSSSEQLSSNIQSFLSLNIKCSCDEILKMYRNVLISIPLLMELFKKKETEINSYIHKCLNKMNLLEKKQIDFEKGKMRLCFQLNRHLMTYSMDFKESVKIINKRLLLDQHNHDPLLNLQKSILILQQKYYILSSTNEQQLTQQLKKGINKQIIRVNNYMQNVTSKRCRSKIFCYIGALAIKLIEKYKNVDLILSKLQKSNFQIHKLIIKIKAFGESSEASYFERKVKIIYFNLLFYKLQQKKVNDIKNYQDIIKEIQDYIRDKGIDSNSEDLNSIMKKITDHISKKKESQITILTSKPLEFIKNYQFKENLHNVFRYEDDAPRRLQQELKKSKKMVCIRTHVLNERNLKEVLDEGCLIQFLVVDIIKINGIYHILLESPNRLAHQISLSQFVQNFDFKNISILIISGYNSVKLQEHLFKLRKYPKLFVICIQKNIYFQSIELQQYWQHDKIHIWNECNRYFLSYFCKILIQQSPVDQMINRYRNAFQITKHKINIKLIQNCRVISKQDDIDKYIMISSEYMGDEKGMGVYYNGDEDSDQGEDYLNFNQGNVITLFNSSEKCDGLGADRGMINFGFNLDIIRILKYLMPDSKKIGQEKIKGQGIISEDTNYNMINIFGHPLILNVIGYQLYKALLRNGEKSVTTYLSNYDENSKKKEYLKQYSYSLKYLIFQHNIGTNNDNEMAVYLKKFEQMCNGNQDRKIILLTNYQVIKEDKEEKQKQQEKQVEKEESKQMSQHKEKIQKREERQQQYRPQKNKLRKKSLQVTINNYKLFAYMYFMNHRDYTKINSSIIQKAIDTIDNIDLRVVNDLEKVWKQVEDKLNREPAKERGSISKKISSSGHGGSDKNIPGTPKTGRKQPRFE